MHFKFLLFSSSVPFVHINAKSCCIVFLPILHTEMKRKTQLELSTFCIVSYMSSKIAQSPVEIARIQMLNKIQERKKWRKFIIAILSIIYVPTRTLIYTRSTEHR